MLNRHVTRRPAGHQPRPLLGLRRNPGRIALALFRLPLNAYGHDAGWMLGHTFMAFTHIGRKTGLPHQAVAMVLRHDPGSREAVICAAWGPDTDWVRNLRAVPGGDVQLGRETYACEHHFLTDDEAFDVALAFRQAHPHRLRLLSAILGWGDLRDDTLVREFLHTHPLIAFRPGDVRSRGRARRRHPAVAAGAQGGVRGSLQFRS